MTSSFISNNPYPPKITQEKRKPNHCLLSCKFQCQGETIKNQYREIYDPTENNKAGYIKSKSSQFLNIAKKHHKQLKSIKQYIYLVSFINGKIIFLA